MSAEVGVGLAVTVKLASQPSVILEPAEMLMVGVTGGGSSSSETATVAALFVPETVYPVPVDNVAVTEPSGSSVLSSVVITMNVALPDAGIVTVSAPVVTPKLPFSETVRLTVNAEVGFGVAVTVNVASLPSVTADPAAIVITGVTTGGSSLSDTATVAALADEDTV